MKSTKTNRSAFERPVIDSPLVQVVLVVNAFPVCMVFQLCIRVGSCWLTSLDLRLWSELGLPFWVKPESDFSHCIESSGRRQTRSIDCTTAEAVSECQEAQWSSLHAKRRPKLDVRPACLVFKERLTHAHPYYSNQLQIPASIEESLQDRCCLSKLVDISATDQRQYAMSTHCLHLPALSRRSVQLVS